MNPEQYVYSRGAAAAILELKKKDIEEVAPTAIAIRIYLTNGSSKLVSKRLFKEYFATSRQQRGEEITIHQMDTKVNYLAESQREVGKYYEVHILPSHLTCTCADWRMQNEELHLEHPTCKHCYAVLKSLNFATLKEYLTAKI